jgi:hypothetical protein
MALRGSALRRTLGSLASMDRTFVLSQPSPPAKEGRYALRS